MARTIISVRVTPSSIQRPLGFEVWLNQTQIFNTDQLIQSQTIECSIDDSKEQQHSLKFILKNKTTDHTVLDQLGAIVQDSLISLNDLKFDDIELGQLFNELSTYTHDFNGTQERVTESFYGTMGCNGTVELKFNTPVYLWLLEQM